MTGKRNPLPAYALALAGATIALGSLGAAGYAHPSTQADQPVQVCEVTVAKSGGSYALEALVHADASMQGSYQFSVKSVGGAGRTSINQGGGFFANNGETVTLGRINLSASSVYEVSLKVDGNGLVHECGGRVGGTA